MTYTITQTEAGNKWNILRGNEVVGDVERLMTGYMITMHEPPLKVKRYRMIDALQEALGEDAEIQTTE